MIVNMRAKRNYHPVEKFLSTYPPKGYSIYVHPTYYLFYLCFEELLHAMIYNPFDITCNNFETISLYLDLSIDFKNTVYICGDFFIINSVLHNKRELKIRIFEYNVNNEYKFIKKCQKEIHDLICYRKYDFNKLNFKRLLYLLNESQNNISNYGSRSSFFTITQLSKDFGLTRNQMNYFIKQYNKEQVNKKYNQSDILFEKYFSQITETEFWS
jgi:hypothetical protein